MFAGRFVTLLVLAALDQGTLQSPSTLKLAIALVLALPGIYAMYSVVRCFGLERAAGADHFHPRYREMPLVRGGIFKYTSNGMYVYAFLLFWAIAIAFNSSAALVVAAFSHLYIWIHFYATERPDMEYLYGE